MFPVHLVHGLSAPALSPPKENFSLMKLRQLDQARAFCLIAFNPLEARNKTKE